MYARFVSRCACIAGRLCNVALLAGVIASCDRATGPVASGPAPLVFETRFPRALEAAGSAVAAQLVPFNRVRINFRRVTGATAVDTSFATQPDFDSVAVTLSIPLKLDLPVVGETMTLTVTCVNEQGDAVYRGGPVVVFVRPGRAAAPVVIQLAYVGTGSQATSIRISPDLLSVRTGQSFSFTATVFDQHGAPIANAPVVWSVVESSLARLTSPLGGVGVALSLAGTAHVIAEVPDGPADTATLTIQPLVDATRLLQLVSGGGQSGLIGALLGQPIVVRVVDAAGNGVSGVPVTFAASNGGGVGSPTATTDAAGRAQTSWTLGSLIGAQTLTASASGLTGNPLSVPATGIAIPPTVATTLTMVASLTNLVAGTALAPITVNATDGNGTLVTSFANNITITLASNPGGATLSGTQTVRAVNGVATFTGLSLDKAASGYSLTATSSGLSSATSGTFSITHAAAAILAIAGGDGQSAVLSALLSNPLQVRVTDAFGNAVPSVSVSWGVTLGGGVLGNATSQTNASGVASCTWTLGLLVGLQHATAVANGLSGSPAIFSATGLLGLVAVTLPTLRTSAQPLDARDGLGVHSSYN